MLQAVALVALGVFSRLLPHPHNMVPMAAIALYAAAKLPRGMAAVVPLSILVLSDVAIDLGHGYPFFFTSRLTTYAAFTGLVAFGWLVPRNAGMSMRVGAALVGSTLFFLVSNFAVWAGGEGFGYPRTLSGLLSTYAVALPFYRNGLIADVAGTVLLFGIDGLLVSSAESRRQTSAAE